MNFHYDKQLDALSVRFSDKRYIESDQVQDNIIFDYDRDGNVIAIEILNASKVLPKGFTAPCVPNRISFSIKDFAAVAR